MPDELIAAMVTAPILPGSLVLIAGHLIGEDEMPRAMNELRRVCGHEQFLIVQVPDGVRMNVAGPDDLVDALRRLAREAVKDAREEGGTLRDGDDGETDVTGEGLPVLRPPRDKRGTRDER